MKSQPLSQKFPLTPTKKGGVQIMNLLLKDGDMSTAEIAKKTEVCWVTAARRLVWLAEQGGVEKARRHHTNGRPVQMWRLTAKARKLLLKRDKGVGSGGSTNDL